MLASRTLPVTLVALALAAPAARAAPPAFVLAYERDVEAFACPSRDELASRVRERLGRDPWRARASRGVAVHIEPSRYGYVASIALYQDGDKRGERVLSSTGYDCEPLADAVVLAVSIAIDPTHGLAPPPERAPSTAPGARADDADELRLILDTGTARERAPAPLRDDPTALSFELGAGGYAGVGAAPGALFGLVAQTAARSGALSFHLELRAELPGRVPIGTAIDADPATVGGSLIAAAVHPCLRVVGGPFLPNGRFAWASLCGVLQGGGLFVSAFDVRDASAGVAPFAAVGGRLHLDVALLRWLSLRLFFEVLVPVTRVTLTDRVTGAPLWEPPFVNLAVGASGITLLP